MKIRLWVSGPDTPVGGWAGSWVWVRTAYRITAGNLFWGADITGVPDQAGDLDKCQADCMFANYAHNPYIQVEIMEEELQ